MSGCWFLCVANFGSFARLAFVSGFACLAKVPKCAMAVRAVQSCYNLNAVSNRVTYNVKRIAEGGLKLFKF